MATITLICSDGNVAFSRDFLVRAFGLVKDYFEEHPTETAITVPYTKGAVARIIDFVASLDVTIDRGNNWPDLIQAAMYLQIGPDHDRILAGKFSKWLRDNAGLLCHAETLSDCKVHLNSIDKAICDHIMAEIKSIVAKIQGCDQTKALQRKPILDALRVSARLLGSEKEKGSHIDELTTVEVIKVFQDAKAEFALL